MVDEKKETGAEKRNHQGAENLARTRKSFSVANSEFARECQRKGAAKRKENRLMREAAAEALLKKIKGLSFQDVTINKLMEYCLEDNADSEKILKILTFLRDTAGQKPKEEVQAVVMPVVNIKGL